MKLFLGIIIIFMLVVSGCMSATDNTKKIVNDITQPTVEPPNLMEKSVLSVNQLPIPTQEIVNTSPVTPSSTLVYGEFSSSENSVWFKNKSNITVIVTIPPSETPTPMITTIVSTITPTSTKIPIPTVSPKHTPTIVPTQTTIVPTTTKSPTPTLTPFPTPIPGETFGAEASNPTGNSIGGGAGYNRIITSTNPNIKYTVFTKDQFLDALKIAKPGEVIFIPSNVTIDVTGYYGIKVPAGVTIASDRGYEGSPGGKIFRSHVGDYDVNYSHIQTFNAGDKTRFTGLRIEGTDTLQDECNENIYEPNCAKPAPKITKEVRSAINCQGDVEVDNCEMYGWSHAAVGVRTYRGVYVHHNYIHHCHARGYGYGVVIDGGYAVIEANIFDYTRHAIAAVGAPSEGYEARYNIHLGNGDAYGGHHFDVHGYSYNGGTIAGNEYKIHHNTFMSTDLYSIGIRGKPIKGVYIDHNIFESSWSGHIGFQRASNGEYANVFMTNNIISGVFKAKSTLLKA